jgi:hypothetical protein
MAYMDQPLNYAAQDEPSLTARSPDLLTRSYQRSRADFTLFSARVLLLVAYLAVAFGLLVYFNVGLGPDATAFVMVGATLVAGQGRLLVRDWGVFLLVLLLWRQTGPVALWAAFPLHMSDLINADRFITWPLLHGQLPQEWLQQHLYHPGFVQRTQYHAGYWHGHVYHRAWWDHIYHPTQWQWYDILSCVIYGLHFPEALVVGAIIWVRDQALYRRFATAFLMLSTIAFVSYVVYPAVPPWMASYHTFQGHTYAGIVPPLHKIFDECKAYLLTMVFAQHHSHLINLQWDLTAATPSLHAALPLLSSLYLRKSLGRWGLLMLGYGAIVWFAILYMGEHWVVDILAGLLCAVVAYVAVEGIATERVYRAARRVKTAAIYGS